MRRERVNWKGITLRKILLLMACVMFPATAFADTSDIRSSNNQIGIQGTLTKLNYTETGNGLFGTQTGTLDTETGNVFGGAVSISIMKNLLLGNDYIEAEYDHSSGNTGYSGTLLQGGVFSAVTGTSGATLDNYSVRYGKGFDLNGEIMATIYIELGNHKWYRLINYGELYTNNYYGLGVLGQYSPVSQWVFSANGLLGHTFGSNIDVNGGGGRNGFSGGLGNSALYKLGVSADYAFTQHFHGNFGLDYVSFRYGIGSVYPIGGGLVAWEPDSATHYTIAKAGLSYAF
jgi:hypothetical protein